MWILRRGESALTAIEFDEPIYDVCEGPNCNFDSSVLRLHYNSMTTPRTVIDVDTQTLEVNRTFLMFLSMCAVVVVIIVVVIVAAVVVATIQVASTPLSEKSPLLIVCLCG